MFNPLAPRRRFKAWIANRFFPSGELVNHCNRFCFLRLGALILAAAILCAGAPSQTPAAVRYIRTTDLSYSRVDDGQAADSQDSSTSGPVESGLSRRENEQMRPSLDSVGSEQVESIPRPLSMLDIRVDVSLLRHVIGDHFATQNKVAEMILGTHAVGTAVTKGQYELELRPSSTTAQFVLQFDGTCEANTLCTQQPITFDSQTTTTFVGRKIISFHPSKGFSSEPAVVAAETSSSYGNVHPLRRGLGQRLIRRIATQQIEQNRQQAEAICARRTATRVGQMIDHRIDERLAAANESWRLAQFTLISLLTFESKFLTLNTSDQHLTISIGKSLSNTTKLSLGWTESDGLVASLAENSPIRRTVALLAVAYERAFAPLGQSNWERISQLRRLAVKQLGDIIPAKSSDSRDLSPARSRDQE